MSKILKLPGALGMLAALLSVGLAGCGGGDGSPKPISLAIGHSLDVEHPVHKAMEFMAAQIDQQSSGTIKLEVFPSSQLGSEREMIEQLQQGQLDMVKTSTAPMENFLPVMGVYSMPYLFRDEAHYWKVLDGPVGEELAQAGESVGLHGLCYYDSGARSFYTKSKPIRTPADLAGLKIRVMKSKVSESMVNAMGASPTPIEWGELYTSLQQGVVDGAENNPPSLYTSRHYEVCKFYTLDEHTRIPDLVLISTTRWNSLTPDQQRIINEAADASSLFQRKLWQEMTQKSMDEIAKAGTEVIVPDKKPFQDAVAPLYQEYETSPFGDYIKRIQAVE